MKNRANGGKTRNSGVKTAPKTSLKERLVSTSTAGASPASRRSFFSADGSRALFADLPDDGKGVEAFVEFSRSDSAALETAFEFYSNGRRAFAGDWKTELYADETPLVPTAKWETVCEELNDEYSFLERNVELTGKRRFSRRLFLARNETLFLIADAIFASSAEFRSVQAGKAAPVLRFRNALPIADGVLAKQDDEAREVAFFENGAVDLAFARVFPLTATEWRADRSTEDFYVENSVLVTTAERRGTSLFVATLIDGNSRRASRPCSWRRLTVGESLEVAPDDAAIGRKIQLGKERFVLYASTSERPAIRSILGRNLLSDFMFGKFFADRGVEPIVDVETLVE